MKLVAQNAKKGAQFTPQGVLRFPLRHRAAGCTGEIRALLEELTRRGRNGGCIAQMPLQIVDGETSCVETIIFVLTGLVLTAAGRAALTRQPAHAADR